MQVPLYIEVWTDKCKKKSTNVIFFTIKFETRSHFSPSGLSRLWPIESIIDHQNKLEPCIVRIRGKKIRQEVVLDKYRYIDIPSQVNKNK